MNVIVDHPIRYRRADEDFAFKDCPHRGDKLIQRLAFHDIAACTRSQGSFGVKRFVMHGQNQYRQARPFRSNRLGQFDPVGASFQADVNHRQVKPVAPEGIKSLLGVAGLRAHFYVRFISQQLHHAFAK